MKSALPKGPHPDDAEEPPPFDHDLKEDEQVDRPELVRRQWRITAEMVKEHGFTLSCEGCRAMRDGRAQRGHDKKCRERFEAIFGDDPIMKMKFQASRQRVGR